MYRERTSRLGGGAVLWRIEGPPAPGAGPGLVLPDGCMDLIWSEADDTLLVAGPDTRAHAGGSVPGAAWAGVRFAPGAAPALLGVPAVELRDRRVPLAELRPAAEVRRLAGRVAGAADRGTALEAAAAAVALPGEPDPVCRELVAALRRGAAVRALARAVALSERQLHRRALAAFGYGPKTLARVLRLQRALGLAGGGLPLAEVAVVAGYADQPHLARDVKALTGHPLTTLLPNHHTS